MGSMLKIREANNSDLIEILDIYNQGIIDKIATLEVEKKNIIYMTKWFTDRSEKYKILVAELNSQVVGWHLTHTLIDVLIKVLLIYLYISVVIKEGRVLVKHSYLI